ncbi:hypothetical protein ACSBR2_012159 [Camellia fascicularis]
MEEEGEEDQTEPTTRHPSLDDFPVDLLLYILSFLPTIDAVKTSSVSRKWRNLWSSVPSLSFDYSIFPPADTPFLISLSFADFVDRTLLLRPPLSSLLKFRLQFDFSDDFYSCHVNSWVSYAVDHLALELDLDFFIDRIYDDDNDNDNDGLGFGALYDFPFGVLKNSRVRVLKLCHCYLSVPPNLSTMRFHSVKSMVFDQVGLSDDMVSALILGCPNLEILGIDYCWAIRNLKICSAKLKELSLRNFVGDEESSVEICAPNLISISIAGFEMGKYGLKASSLVKAHICFPHKLHYYSYWSKIVRLVGHVECLTVQNWWFKLLASEDVFSESSALKNLKHLELRTRYSKSYLLGMCALLERSPNLKTMILDYLPQMDKDESLSEDLLDKPISLSMPNLSQVKMNSFQGTANEIDFVKLLKMQGSVLEKIVIIPAKGHETTHPRTVLRRIL